MLAASDRLLVRVAGTATVLRGAGDGSASAVAVGVRAGMQAQAWRSTIPASAKDRDFI